MMNEDIFKQVNDILAQAGPLPEAPSAPSDVQAIQACVDMCHAMHQVPFQVNGIAAHHLPSGEVVYVAVSVVQARFMVGHKEIVKTILHHDVVVKQGGVFTVVPMEGGDH